MSGTNDKDDTNVKSQNPTLESNDHESFHTNKCEFSTNAESELIDVDDIELSDEESWLFKSPKKLSSAGKEMNSQKGCHENVENMDDMGLNLTKHALVSKLNQLQMQATKTDMKITEGERNGGKNLENKETCDTLETSKASTKVLPAVTVELPCNEDLKVGATHEGKNKEKLDELKGKENEILDVTDVHKMAQLQEERLRQSIPRFLNQSEKKNGEGKHFLMQNTKLSKPVSMEDVHRGSLPNINPGYYSLRALKSKRSSEPRIACPLPVRQAHSKLSLNGAGYEAPAYESQRKLISPLCNYPESQTLPSSYRMNSRSNSSSWKDLSALSPSPRRKSGSVLPPSQRSPTSQFPRRESAPCNPPKYLSPISSPTKHHTGSSSPLGLQSPTKRSMISLNHLKTPPSAKYHRSTSNSPSRRLPLTTVHNHSPKHGNNPASSPCTEDIQAFKLASKIPSPASRSGIPVPSYTTRVNSDYDSWNQDCF